jgi:ankyrin repeat protein
MLAVSPKQAINFIKKNTTPLAFFNYVTNNGQTDQYDINQPVSGWTALRQACKVGNLTLVKALLHASANVNSISSSGDSPLSAAINGYLHSKTQDDQQIFLDIIKLLALKGAILANDLTGKRMDAISWANKLENKKIYNFFMYHQSNHLSEHIINSLRYDEKFRKKALFNKLLPLELQERINIGLDENRIRIHTKNGQIYSVALTEAVNNNDIDQVKMILENYPLDPVSCFTVSSYLTKIAMRHRNLEMVKILVTYGDCIIDNINNTTLSRKAKCA